MATSISALLIICLRDLNGTCTTLESRTATRADLSFWEDELGRLRLWAANIGAHRKDQSGLDYRLRDASHIKQAIVKLLSDLLGTLEEVKEVLSEDQEFDQDCDSDSSSDNEETETELQQLHRILAVTITSLFQMSMLVRKPAPHNLFMDPTANEVSAYEPFDVAHVRNKFPDAEDFLVKRLGTAITRRRKYLKYRERHYTKLSAGLDDMEGKAHDGASTIYSATDITRNRPVILDLGDQISESGVSQTSYASTLAGGGDLAMPPPPKGSRGGASFQCPYCFLLISVSNTQAWYKHLFEDLLPYSCTISTCSIPNKVYPTRREWLRHMNGSHESDWFPTTPFDGDLQQTGGGSTECSLCKEDFYWGKHYERHVARHLQELALFVLPRSDEDLYDSEREGESHSFCSSDDDKQIDYDYLPVAEWQVDEEGTDQAHNSEIDFEDTKHSNNRPIPVEKATVEPSPSTKVNFDQDADTENTPAEKDKAAMKSAEERITQKERTQSWKTPQDEADATVYDEKSDGELLSAEEPLWKLNHGSANYTDYRVVEGLNTESSHSNTHRSQSQNTKAPNPENESRSTPPFKSTMPEQHDDNERLLQPSMSVYDENSPRLVEELLGETARRDALEAAREAASAAAGLSLPPTIEAREKEKPIKFKDAIGRRFNFPFHMVSTWTGMEYLIKEAFLHVENYGPHVAEGNYDLCRPDGGIISKTEWEAVAEPGMEISMQMWPLPEPPSEPDPLEAVADAVIANEERGVPNNHTSRSRPPFFPWGRRGGGEGRSS